MVMRRTPVVLSPFVRAADALAARPAAAVTMHPRGLRARHIRSLEGFLFVLPVVLGTLIFNILPMVPTMALSLTSWDALSPPVWVGLGNFTDLVADASFLGSIWVTSVYTLLTVPLGTLAGLGLALLVNQKFPGVVAFRGLYFLPVITSEVAIGMAWRWMFNWQYGLINFGLGSIGLEGPRWLGIAPWAIAALVVVTIWQVMGYNMVIFLAGLQGVPQQVKEAAIIDGANSWQRFMHVVLPLLSPTTFFVVLISLIRTLQAFSLIFVMTEGGPGSSTEVYVYRLWTEAFKLYKMGYASAMAWIFFVIIAALTWANWKLQSRWVHYD